MKQIAYVALVVAVSAAYAGDTTHQPTSAPRQPFSELQVLTDEGLLSLTDGDGPWGHVNEVGGCRVRLEPGSAQRCPSVNPPWRWPVQDPRLVRTILLLAP
jgi:hypothetical protein